MLCRRIGRGIAERIAERIVRKRIFRKRITVGVRIAAEARIDLGKIDQYVQGRGAAEMGVEIAHPLVDLGVLVEVVDEARLDRKARDARDRDGGQDEGDGDRSQRAVRREAAQRLRGINALALGAARGALREQYDHCGKEHERNGEGDCDADGHHPAEIDHRDNAGTHE